MKISPIQVAYSNLNHSINNKQKQNNLAENRVTTAPISDNYGRAMVFKAASKDITKIVQNASLDDKIAVGIKHLKQAGSWGNFLCVVKDMKDVSDLISYAADSFPIGKVFTIQHKDLLNPLLLTSFDNKTFVINTSSHAMFTGMLDAIPPGEISEIKNEDDLRVPSCWIHFHEEPDNAVVAENSNLFLQTFDCTNGFNALISKHSQEIDKFLKQTFEGSGIPKSKMSFAQIGGQDKVIDSLKKGVLFPLKYPDVFDGFMVSRGAILYGPPGTGKTLLAKTLAEESGASVFELCGTDLADKWVGGSEKNCRELFEKAVDAQPSIIYFDEIDALGKKRGDDKYGDKLLAQFLSLMSDLEKRNDQVYIIGSTNRKEDLDPAFVRSGRFSMLLEVKPPDLEGTKQIFSIHTNGKPIDQDVNKDLVAEKMYAKKMTGADIAATVKEAFSHALERTGIYESMDNGRFSPMMKEHLTINNEDFISAINQFKADKTQRRPIGYNK